MKELQYTYNLDEKGVENLFYILPPSYENSVVTLLLDNTILVETKFGPSETERKFFTIKNPLTSTYKHLKKRLLLNYFGHKGQADTNLFYIHPPKCGGSSIEMCGYEYGVRWSRWVGSESYPNYHAPSSYFIQQKELLKNKILFTSCRNPYNRLISDVYCPYNLHTTNKFDKELSPIEFNEMLDDKIKNLEPVYNYVYHNEKKVIPHVLKLENLTYEFNKLMFEYNSPIRMNNISNKSNDFYEFKKLGIENIDKSLMRDINKKYKKDFIYFGYEVIL